MPKQAGVILSGSHPITEEALKLTQRRKMLEILEVSLGHLNSLAFDSLY